MLKTILIIGLSFAAGFALPYGLTPFLPRADAGFSYVAIAASFVLNLGCLAFALGLMPSATPDAPPMRLPYLRSWIKTAAAGFFAHAGLWASTAHGESWRVFAVLAFLFAAQAAALAALHAAASVIFGVQSRAPRLACVLVLSVLACALFWTREPIQRLSKSGVDGAQNSQLMAEGVMKLSPPAAVAAAWYHNSDSARASAGTAVRRFDLVHGTLTYAVWIGSYQTVPTPDVMFSGSSDFYAQQEFSAGIALTLLAWGLPLLILCDVLLRKDFSRTQLPAPTGR